MLYDALEEVYTVINTNFVADLVALALAKSETIETTTAIVKRQKADTAIREGATLPVLTLYAISGTSQAKNQGQRYSTIVLGSDYVARGTDPVKLAKQAELYVEALHKSIDRVWPNLEGGAGEGLNSIEFELADSYDDVLADGAVRTYEQRATVRFPVVDRDVIT